MASGGPQFPSQRYALAFDVRPPGSLLTSAGYKRNIHLKQPVRINSVNQIIAICEIMTLTCLILIIRGFKNTMLPVSEFTRVWCEEVKRRKKNKVKVKTINFLSLMRHV